MSPNNGLPNPTMEDISLTTVLIVMGLPDPMFITSPKDSFYSKALTIASTTSPT